MKTRDKKPRKEEASKAIITIEFKGKTQLSFRCQSFNLEESQQKLIDVMLVGITALVKQTLDAKITDGTPDAILNALSLEHSEKPMTEVVAIFERGHGELAPFMGQHVVLCRCDNPQCYPPNGCLFELSGPYNETQARGFMAALPNDLGRRSRVVRVGSTPTN